LSREAQVQIAARKGWTLEFDRHGDGFIKDVGHGWETVSTLISRDDPVLIEVVREMGDLANGMSAQLKIVEALVTIEITDYDGIGSIAGSRGYNQY
jgi:hypothetical protein